MILLSDDQFSKTYYSNVYARYGTNCAACGGIPSDVAIQSSLVNFTRV